MATLKFVPLQHASSPNSPAPSFAGFTLLLPAVSIGNVGQLALEALTLTYALDKVGYIYDPDVLPVCGADALAQSEADQCGSLTIALEVFASAQRKVVIVQQRSPVVRAARGAFCERVLRWAAEQRVQHVMLLSSSRSYLRSDAQLQGSQLRYLTTANSASAASALIKAAEKLGIVAWGSDVNTANATTDEADIESVRMAQVLARRISSGGITNALLATYAGTVGKPAPADEAKTRGAGTGVSVVSTGGMSSSAAPAAASAASSSSATPAPAASAPAAAAQYPFSLFALIAFSSEGANTTDGLAMAAAADAVLAAAQGSQPHKGTWSTPLSWEHLFGPPADSSLYL